MAKKTGEPIYLTTNGKGDMVLLSVDAYEKMASDLNLLIELGEAQRDIDAGNVTPLPDDYFDSIKAEVNGSKKWSTV